MADIDKIKIKDSNETSVCNSIQTYPEHPLKKKKKSITRFFSELLAFNKM